MNPLGPVEVSALVEPIDPTTAMIDAGVAFALCVSLGGDYRWSDYIADLWRTMDAARVRAARAAVEVGE